MAILREIRSAHSSTRPLQVAVVSSRGRHRAAQTRTHAQEMKSKR
jgi:hypothetical protein